MTQQMQQVPQTESSPRTSPGTKQAGALLGALREIEARSGNDKETKEKLQALSKSLEESVKSGSIPESAPLLGHIKDTLEKINPDTSLKDTSGLVERPGTSASFSREVLIPISKLGLSKEDLNFNYTTRCGYQCTGRGGISMSANSFRTWRNNLMDISIDSTNSTMSLKVYRGFEGDISFKINDQTYVLTQKGSAYSSNISKTSARLLGDAREALSKLAESVSTQPSSGQSATPQVKNENILEIKSEVSGVRMTPFTPGSTVHDLVNKGREAGIEVVLKEYDKTPTGNVTFELQKEGQPIGDPITLPRNYSKNGKDYLAERNERITYALGSVLGDISANQTLGTTTLQDKVRTLSAFTESPEFQKGLRQLKYFSIKDERGPALKIQWKEALSMRSVREKLSQELTPELITSLNKTLSSRLENAQNLIDWAKKERGETPLTPGEYDLDLTPAKKTDLKEEIKAERASPEVRDIDTPARPPSPGASLSNDSSVHPDFSSTPDILSDGSVPQRASIPEQAPEISTSAERIPRSSMPHTPPIEPAVSQILSRESIEPSPDHLAPSSRSILERNVSKTSQEAGISSFEPSSLPPEVDSSSSLREERPPLVSAEMPVELPDISSLAMPSLPRNSPDIPGPVGTEFDQKTLDQIAARRTAPESEPDLQVPLQEGELRKLDPGDLASFGITDEVKHPELLHSKEGDRIIRGIDPDTLLPLTYRENESEVFTKVDQRYDVLNASWESLSSSRDSRRTDEGHIFNGNIASEILEKNSNVSVSAAYIAEYYLGTHEEGSVFSGNVDTFNTLFFDESKMNLEFVPPSDIVNQHYSDTRHELTLSPSKSIIIPQSSLPEEFRDGGDIIMTPTDSSLEISRRKEFN